jgi:hypothetical protein
MLPYATIVKESRQNIRGPQVVASVIDSSVEIGSDWDGFYSRSDMHSSRL